MTPQTNRRGRDATPDPSAVLREVMANWHLPDDTEAPVEIGDRPPWPDDADGPRLSFAELIDHEALGYRAWETSVGDFLSREMDKLAQSIRWTHATTPEQHEDRMDAWEDDIRGQWEARGYKARREAGCRCGDNMPD